MSYRVVIIGAGFGGIGMAIALKQRRFDLAAYRVMRESQDTAVGGAR